MDEKDLYELVFGFFGYKCRMLTLESERPEVGCILYDTFLFKCHVNARNEIFSCGIIVGHGEATITEYLGKHCSPKSDVESIKNSLKMIDDYCRLRLPEKFIEAYFQVYSASQYKDQ